MEMQETTNARLQFFQLKRILEDSISNRMAGILNWVERLLFKMLVQVKYQLQH